MTDQKASLLFLPTEILTLILRYCRESWDDDKESDLWSDPNENENEHHHFSALCLTCRRLRAIALPMLYADICFSKNQQEIAAFLKHMQKTPQLADLILFLSLSLPLSLSEPASDHTRTPVPLPAIWPNDGSPGPPPFQNLISITLRGAMIPLSMDKLPSEHFVFPALEECYFGYGGLSDQMSYHQFQIASFIPFWTSPKLRSFGLRGSGMHIIGSGRSNTHPDHRSCIQLTGLEKFSIGCQIDATAIKWLMGFRATKRLLYEAPFETREGCHFDNYAEFLVPCVQDLACFWYMDTGSQRPSLSPFAAITSLELSAPVLADFSTEHESFDKVELLCKLPIFLKHLEVRVEPRETHRRQFYKLITRMAEQVLLHLDSLELDFGIANYFHSDGFYWNNRSVSERERADRDVTDEMLYGANGQTVEHNHLRNVCQDSSITLRSQYMQNFQKDNQRMIVD